MGPELVKVFFVPQQENFIPKHNLVGNMQLIVYLLKDNVPDRFPFVTVNHLEGIKYE